MNDLKEKAAYLRGLVKGIDPQQDEKQNLIWEGLINFCDSAAESLNELGDSQEEIADYVDQGGDSPAVSPYYPEGIMLKNYGFPVTCNFKPVQYVLLHLFLCQGL